MREGGTWSLANLRYPLIALSFIVVLGLALGSQALFYRTHVRAPLTTEFASIPGVQSAQIVSRDGQSDVVITLSGTVDLPETYSRITRAAREGLGGDLGRVVLHDNRTAALRDDFDRLSFAVQEGIATGRFVQMEQRIAQAVKSMSLTSYRVAVDTHYVYLQLHQADHSLYAVVPRVSTDTLGVSTRQQAGGQLT